MKFYLKKSAAATQLIMLKIHDTQFSDGRFHYSTKERIEPKLWDEKKGRAKGVKDYLNARLGLIESEASKFISLNRGILTKDALRDHLDSLRPKEVVVVPKNAMIQEWKDYITSIKGSVSPRTIWNYNNSREVFENFLREKEQVHITPEQFTFRHYQAFQVYLKTVEIKDKAGKVVQTGYSPNTVSKRLKHLKMFVNYLGKMRVNVDMNPDDIKFKEVAGVKISLTEEDLVALENLRLTGTMSRVRDLFVLQCSTGVRVSDLFRIDRNVKEDKIVLETKKVAGNVVEIPLTSRSREILDKYQGKLPVISEQKYRDYIKQLYKAINPTGTIQVRVGDRFENRYIWKEISSHDAVRTFVTLSAERGMPISAIAKIVGKSLSVLLRNYLVENQKTAEKEFKKAWMKVA
jgi:site-specific recombinase XerD